MLEGKLYGYSLTLESVLHVEVAPGAYKQQTGSGWSCDRAMSPFSLGFIVRVYLSNWTSHSPFRQFNKCERFEPRSHFKSRLSLIVRLNVVLNRTVVVDSDWRFDNLCGSHLQSQSELYHVSWWSLKTKIKHQIDWDSATCITYSTDYYQRLTLESWFTNLEQTPLNLLPAPYKRLIDEIKQN